jgi:hypothetical protein
MTNGSGSYVIPMYSNAEYMRINSGEHFGVIDIVGSTQFIEEDLDSWYDFKNRLKRQFSVQSIEETETLSLSLDYLLQM